MNVVALIVGYLRVSTREQGIHGFSPDVQRDAIERYAAGYFGAEPYELVFVEDIGGSGGIGLRQHPDLFKKHRKGLSNAIDVLLAQMGKRPVHFMALDQSRLERNPLLWHLLEHVYMRQHGIVFHFAHDGGVFVPGSTEAMGRGVQSLANQSHLHSTGRRIAESNEFRARKGYHNGSAPYGWRKVPNRGSERWKDIEPIPELVEILHLMRDKILEGWGSWRIAAYLEAQGIPSPSDNRKWYPEMVRDIARDPMHAGYIKWCGDHIKGRHYELRLWDMEVRNEIDRVISQRHRASRRSITLKDFLLAGMLTCGHCGRPLVSAYDGGSGARMYRCSGRIIPPSESHKGINRVAATLEKAVVEEVRRVLSTDIVHNITRQALEESSEAEVAAIRREEDRLRHQLEEAGQDLAEVIQQYRKRKLDEVAYEAVKQTLERTMHGLQKRQEEVKKRREYLGGSALRLTRAREAVTRFRDLWEHLDVEEQRGLLQALLGDVVVFHEGRNIRLVFRYHFLPETEVLVRPMTGRAGSEGAEQLSQRELAVLHLRHQGLSTGDIGKVMDVSRTSINQHYHGIRRKLGTHDLDRCYAVAQSRIEAELLFLPIRGRANRRPNDEPLLTPREQEALTAIEGGETYEHLAKRLGRSKSSLYNMVYNARMKLKEAQERGQRDDQEAK